MPRDHENRSLQPACNSAKGIRKGVRRPAMSHKQAYSRERTPHTIGGFRVRHPCWPLILDRYQALFERSIQQAAALVRPPPGSRSVHDEPESCLDCIVWLDGQGSFQSSARDYSRNQFLEQQHEAGDVLTFNNCLQVLQRRFDLHCIRILMADIASNLSV